jgi:hypothetical protein
MAIIRPPISGDSPQDSWMNQVTEAINKGLLAPSVNPSEAAVISVDNFSAATIYLYTRTTTATAPAVLTQDLTYDYSQASFTTSPPFGSANWETSPPGIVTGDYLWIITVNISANVGQEIIPAASWSIPQIFSVNGSSSIVIEAYLRAASLPSTPTGGSYNFVTKTLTPPSGGWSQSFPSGSNPVYIVTTTASIVGTEGVDSSLTWSSPVKMVEDGATGASTNIIFQRSATQPSAPSASANIPAGWYDDASSAPGTDLLWASSGIKVINSNTFTWSTPFRIEGESIAEVAVYRLNSNAGLTDGTYNFVTNTLTPPSGWLIEPPSLAVDGDIIYRASGVASGSAKETSASVIFGSTIVFARRTDGATGASTNIIFQRSSSQPSTPSASSGIPLNWYDDASSAPGTALLWASSGFKAINSSTFSWTTPFRIEGESVTEIAIYRLNNNTGLTGGTYNFVTNTLTPPTNWLTSAPSITTNGDVVYRASGVASGSALETSASVTFGTPVIFIQRTDGIDATEIETGLVYYNQASTNNPGTPSASGYNFSTNSFSGLSAGWQITPVTVNITTTTALFWSSRFRVTQAPSASSPTIVFDTPIPSVNFGTNIQSDNYIAGSSGWQIQRASGDAEFNDITARGSLTSGSFDGVLNDLDNTISTYSTATGTFAANVWGLRDGFSNNAANISAAFWSDYLDPVSNTDHVVLKVRASTAAITKIISQLGRGQEITITRTAGDYAVFEVWSAGYTPEDGNTAYIQLRNLSTAIGTPGNSAITLEADNVVDPGTEGYLFSDDVSVINSGTLDVSHIRINGSIQAKNLDIGVTLQSKAGSRGGVSTSWREFLRLETADNPDYNTDVSYDSQVTVVSEHGIGDIVFCKVLDETQLGTEGSAAYSSSQIGLSVGSTTSFTNTIDSASIQANSPGASSSFTTSMSDSNVNVTRATIYIFCYRERPGGDTAIGCSASGSITEVRRPA